jgi:hypothetical protein
VRFLAATLLAAALICASAVAGSSVNLSTLLKPELTKVKHKTAIPVLLPARLPLLDKSKVYASSSATKKGFEFDLAYAPNCFGADACFLALFAGQKGGSLPGAANVRLAGGDRAFYKGITCGGSCSPASLWFIHDGVLYSWQDKDVGGNAKALLVGLANQAIAAGPR